jgi:GTP-binding protein
MNEMIPEYRDHAAGKSGAGQVQKAPRRYLPLVAIVGRPNVGKSSLFNRFLKQRLAVVDDMPGVTRDRNYAVCDWRDREFYLIDTGGMLPDSVNLVDKEITRQAELAVEEADVILFVVDSHVDPEQVDEKIARVMQQSGKAVILVANKSDTDDYDREIYRFDRLGLGNAQPSSATGGRHIGDLLDALVESLPAPVEEVGAADEIRIAVIGRPNVGKSSLVNCILGSDRNVVSDVAGTTRDAIDSHLEYQEQRYTLIDTAGLRRKMKVVEGLEFYTNLRAIRALESCDVALVVVDVTDGLTSQDLHIIQQAQTVRRGIVLVVNKWDLQEKDGKTADIMTRDLQDKLGEMKYIPIVYVSALEGKRALKTLQMARDVHTRGSVRYGTSVLNEFLAKALNRRRPPSARGKEIRIDYLSQPETNPPTFVFFSNRPEDLPKSYIRFLINRLRESFDFSGVPIRVKFKKK